MLDSNVLVDIAREPDGVVSKHFGTKVLGEISVSVIVAGEARYGMQKRPNARSNPSMAYLLNSLRIEQMDDAVGAIYGRVRSEAEQRGLSMSPNDYWIVAHAISHDAVLVTSDRAIHDAGVLDLKLENWRDDIAGQERN